MAEERQENPLELSYQQVELRRRRRPALSCVECRRKKIGCDRKHPCRRCISAGRHCTYRTEDKSTTIAQRDLRQDNVFTHTANPLAHAEYVGNETAESGPTAPHNQEVIERNETLSLDRIQFVEHELRTLLERMGKLEDSQLFSERASSKSNRDGFANQSSLQTREVAVRTNEPLKISKWEATPPEFASIMSYCKETAMFKQLPGGGDGTSVQDPDIKPLVVQTIDLLRNCKTLAREMKAERPTRVLSHPQLNIDPPSREFADTMVELYFDFFESSYRIIHIPTFWKDYNRYWNDPNGAPIVLRLEILLVIAVGSSVAGDENDHASFRNKVNEWIYAAQVWLTGPLEKDRLSIKGIQVHCLTILARQVLGLAGDLVWVSMGSIIHQAMQMGLHRDPNHLPGMTLLQSELRRRLWAVILEMVVQSSLASEMPPRISIDEYDTASPSNVNDNEIDESTTEVRSRPRNEYTMTSVQLALNDSLPTRLRIVQLLNGLSRELSYTDVCSLTTRLVNACGSIKILMNQNKNPGVVRFQQDFADHLVRSFLLYLHVPFSWRVNTNTLFWYSRKISLDAALAFISSASDESDSNHSFSRLMAIGGGLFKGTIRHASVAISLELLAQTQSQRSDGTLFRHFEYRALLKQAVKKLVSLSEERIRHGETNVKNHTFLSMILAETEAIEQGTAGEFEIAKSARDSLQLCYDLLQAQVNHTPIAWSQEADFIGLDGEFLEYNLDFDIGNFLQDGVFTWADL